MAAQGHPWWMQARPHPGISQDVEQTMWRAVRPWLCSIAGVVAWVPTECILGGILRTDNQFVPSRRFNECTRTEVVATDTA